MTVETATRIVERLADGVVRDWPFGFKYFAPTHVRVSVVDGETGDIEVLPPEQYAITAGSGNVQDGYEGGSVEYPISPLAALPDGDIIRIERFVPYTQTGISLTTSSGFDPRVVEREFDLGAMRDQQLLDGQREFTGTDYADTLQQAEFAAEASQQSALQAAAARDAARAVFSTFLIDTFAGDAEQVAFAPSEDPVVLENTWVTVDGVVQVPGTDYTLASGIITFAEAPGEAAAIMVRHGRVLDSGPPGPQGVPGENGPEGVQGPPGNAFAFQGEIASVEDLPAEGDPGTGYVIDGHMWVWLVDEWVDAGNIQGPQGPAGDTGPTGPPGSALTILGELDDAGDLPGSGSAGDAYLITGDLWTWVDDEWVNVGSIQGPAGPQGNPGTPGADGFVTSSSQLYALTDARHLRISQGLAEVDKPSARTNLDVAQKQSARMDGTEGRGLVVGAFGLGVGSAGEEDDLTTAGACDNVIRRGWHRITTANLAVTGGPPNATSGFLFTDIFNSTSRRQVFTEFARDGRIFCRARNTSGVWTTWLDIYSTGPEAFGALGDGTTDDSDALEAWLSAPVVKAKIAPAGKTYRITRVIDLSVLGPHRVHVDFSTSRIFLDFVSSSSALLMPAYHTLKNVTIYGRGDVSNMHGIITPDTTDGRIHWHNVAFHSLRNCAALIQTDNFVGTGFISISNVQTLGGGALPGGYSQGALRFTGSNINIEKLEAYNGNRRAFSFNGTGIYVGYVYCPLWVTTVPTNDEDVGQVIYCNHVLSATFARVDILSYYVVGDTPSGIAVYFSRDCQDVHILSGRIWIDGSDMRTECVRMAGTKRCSVQNMYLRSRGQVASIQGHRNFYTSDDNWFENCEFVATIPTGSTLDRAPVSIGSDIYTSTNSGGETRDLSSARVINCRGRLSSSGNMVGQSGGGSDRSGRGGFFNVHSCIGDVLFDGIMFISNRSDVIAITTGTGTRAMTGRAFIRNSRIRNTGRFGVMVWKGEAIIEGGDIDCPSHTAVWNPSNADASAKVQIRGIRTTGIIGLSGGSGSGHRVHFCQATSVTVDGGGVASYNVS